MRAVHHETCGERDCTEWTLWRSLVRQITRTLSAPCRCGAAGDEPAAWETRVEEVQCEQVGEIDDEGGVEWDRPDTMESLDEWVDDEGVNCEACAEKAEDWFVEPEAPGDVEDADVDEVAHVCARCGHEVT